LYNKNLRMNRLFGASKKEEVPPPPPAKKEEPEGPPEAPKKTSVPLTEQQARVITLLCSLRTKSEKSQKRLLDWIIKPRICSKNQRKLKGQPRKCTSSDA
jgi:hypothetical protein